jgi:hypothetical protein
MKTNKYWFRPKKYGWGFTPISWEGWLLTLALIILIIASAYINSFFTSYIELKEGLRFILDLVFAVSIFSIVSERKMKESLMWRWRK